MKKQLNWFGFLTLYIVFIGNRFNGKQNIFRYLNSLVKLEMTETRVKDKINTLVTFLVAVIEFMHEQL